MKHLNLWLILSGIAFAIISRVVIPFGKVFTDHGIILNTPDAYTMIRYADTMPNYMSWDFFSGFPTGTPVMAQQVFPLILSALSSSLHVSNYTVAAILPVVLFFLTLIAVYTAAKMLFDSRIAAVSVFTLCLLPGEILNRTSLGAGDYHCWEIFLLSNIMMIAIVALDSHNSVWKFLLWIEAAILFAIYWFSWMGALLAPVILLVATAVICYFRYCKSITAKLALILSIVGGSILFLANFPGSVPARFVLGFSLDSGITETEPLFFTFGKFDLVPMMAYFGITFYFVLAGIGWLIYRVFKYRKSTEIMFLSWAAITLWMMFIMRRFDYYFAVPGAIVIAYIVVQLIQIIGKQHLAKIAIVVAIVLCLPLIKQSVVTALSDYGYPSQDWVHTAQYLRSQNNAEYEKAYSTGSKPPYGVFSWWGKGNWLMCIGHQAVYSNNGTGARNDNAEILLSAKSDISLEKLRQSDIRYLVISQDMFKSSGLPTSNLRQTFMYKAYYGQVSDLYLVCQYGDVKTFKIKEAIK